MKIRLVLVAISIVFLSNCGLQKGGAIRQDFSDFGGNLSRMVGSKGVKAEKTLNNQEIIRSDYGYVVGAFNGRNEWVHIEKSYKDSCDKFEEVELPFKNNPLALFGMKEGYSYDVYKLKPGRYTLVFYSSSPNNTVLYRSIDPDKDQNELIKQTDSIYASFEVKAGELIYIGDIEIINNKNMNIINNQQNVIEYLSENYPNLNDVAKLLQIKLAQKGKNFQ